ncbi:hypothetical protein K439DRAFT_1631963 [Ramaria rubella]|nr:hypothetical protein K439DRAFT_1631963 [Ramaria rubella]
MVSSEVRLMWQERPRITTFLYFTVRYLIVPRIILQFVPVPAKTVGLLHSPHM